MPNEPILLKKGDTIYVRSVDNWLAVHMKVTVGDRGVYFHIDPLDRGEKHFFPLEDLYISFLRDKPLTVKKYIGDVLTTVFSITEIDMSKNTIDIFPYEGFEAFDLNEPA